MITAPSGLISNMDSYTRNPTAKVFISWDTVLLSGEWFRLDQSQIDTGAILSQAEYEDGATIIEGLSSVDSRVYADETEFLLGLEGYAELLGDSYQYSISDMDIELDNTNNRYTPRDNKNRLSNPGFEFSKDDWNEVITGAVTIEIDEDIPKSKIRDLQINNPSDDPSYVFSDVIAIYDTDGYTITPLESAEDWNLSFYVTGSGVVNLNLLAFSLTASGAVDISTGYLGGAAVQELVSGSWARPNVTMNVPVGTSYLRAVLSTSGTLAKFDDGQTEQSITPTDYNGNFVGDLILPKRAIRSEVGFNNYNIPKFVGLTNKFIPSVSKDTIQVFAYDMADRLKDIIVEDKYYENKRTDELIIELASIAGIGVEQLVLETGTNTIEFAYFQEASVWTYMNQIAESEGGRIFFDETGKLIFWNRNHYRNNLDVRYTFSFSESITDLTYEISKQKVKNRIYVKAYPKKKLTDVRIYNDTTVPAVSAGDTQEFFCQYNYLQEKSVPALNVQVPIIGTDIIANTQEDGGGSNISSDISISSYFIFRESMRINLNNANAALAYLTSFKIYGDPIVIARRIEILDEDTESQSIYDTQELQIENNYITTDAFATTLSTQKLAELKDSRDFIRIDVVGVPYLQLGDIVSVQRSFDGEYENFHIIKNSWSFRDDFMQTLELEKKVII